MFHRRIDNWVRVSPIFLSSELAVLRETLQRVSILLGDSTNLREWPTPIPRFSENVLQQHKHVFKTVANPSRRFYESPRRFGMKHTKTYNSCQKSKELHKNFKTASGSHSGLKISCDSPFKLYSIKTPRLTFCQQRCNSEQIPSNR